MSSTLRASSNARLEMIDEARDLEVPKRTRLRGLGQIDSPQRIDALEGDHERAGTVEAGGGHDLGPRQLDRVSPSAARSANAKRQAMRRPSRSRGQGRACARGARWHARDRRFP
jgi:hypothetical protein